MLNIDYYKLKANQRDYKANCWNTDSEMVFPLWTFFSPWVHANIWRRRKNSTSGPAAYPSTSRSLILTMYKTHTHTHTDKKGLFWLNCTEIFLFILLPGHVDCKVITWNSQCLQDVSQRSAMYRTNLCLWMD